MLLTYERFGAVVLPEYDPSEPIGAFGTRAAYLDLPSGGAYRGYGTEQAPQSARSVRRTGTILGSSLAEVDQVFAALCALRGKVDRLYARRGDGSVVWTLAELSSIEALREPRALFRGCPDVALTVDTEFTLYSPPWNGARHGAGWTFDSGYFFDTGLIFDEQAGDTFTLAKNVLVHVPLVNGGNATVRDLVLQFATASAAITNLTITSSADTVGIAPTQADLVYTGIVNAGSSLFVDCGRQSIGIDSGLGVVGDYAHLSFGASHTLPGWIELRPGTTYLHVTVTSADQVTMTARYSDGWS